MLAQAAIDTRLRPLTALRAVRRLLANPDDTSQVFIVLRAMRGGSAARTFRRFQASPVGARVLAQKQVLLDRLDDGAALSALAPDTLGHCYRDFMQRENLSARGLMQSAQGIDEDNWPPQALLFRDRMRMLHDVGHVLTGYGRDPLGELCLLAFTCAQNGHAGMAMIVVLGMLKALRQKGGSAVAGAVFEGWRHGRKAQWLAEQDWEALLARPLEAVRDELGVQAPGRYQVIVS